jgi:hypothetical protein
MTYDTYRSLSLEGLYELLTVSVKDMLATLESNQNDLIAFNAQKKHVEMLIELIEEKGKINFEKPHDLTGI